MQKNCCGTESKVFKRSETVMPFMFKLESENHEEIQEEVTTCRMQQGISEFM